MKSVIQTITVLIVLSLTIVGSVPAQNAREEEFEAVKEALATAQIDVEAAAKDARMRAEATQRQAETVQREAGAVAKQAETMQRQKEAILLDKLRLDLGLQLASAQQHGGMGRVLVVPTAEMKAEELAAIMQDMNIMTRIFDKKLNYPLRLSEGKSIVLGGWSTSSQSKQFISGDDKATKAIYVGGYGALFFIKVNFPLSPPREVKVEKIEEGVDPVWEETKQEIYAPEEARTTILASPDDIGFDEVLKSMRAGTSALPEYDAEKVDEMKRKLIKTLKHAANIRVLKPQDWVVLAVTGTAQPVVITEIHVLKDDKAGKTITITPKIQEVKPASSSTVLTIRVKKSDIDAFSKGELDFDQFRERTRILTSQAKLGGQQRSGILNRLNVRQSHSTQPHSRVSTFIK